MTALTLVVGGTLVSTVLGSPLVAWVGVLTWFVVWHLVVRRRTWESS